LNQKHLKNRKITLKNEKAQTQNRNKIVIKSGKHAKNTKNNKKKQEIIHQNLEKKLMMFFRKIQTQKPFGSRN